MDLTRLLLIWLSLAALAVAMVLVNIYPYHPNNLAGWGLLALLSLPIVLAGEVLGEKLLGAPFVATLPRVLRISYAVVVVGGATAALVFATPVLAPYLSKWGA